jgi:hypothetical protein
MPTVRIAKSDRFYGDETGQHSPIRVDTSDGQLKFKFGGSEASLGVGSVSGQNNVINTVSDDRTVRINSRSYTQATGDSIGFQSKPNQTVTTTGTVRGGEISPRVAAGVGAGELTALQIYPTLKGATGAVTNVIGLDLIICEDDQESPGRTISGDVTGIKVRSNFVVNPTGQVSVIKVFNAEKSPGNYNALIHFVSGGDGNTAVDSHDLLVSDGAGSVYAAIPVFVEGVGVKHLRIYDES